MPFHYQPVTLGSRTVDGEGQLVFRGGALFAVLSRLDSLHGDFAGGWVIEMTAEAVPEPSWLIFADLEAFELWAIEGLH